MATDAELAAALLAGARMEIMMFNHYNALVGKMDSPQRRQEIANIRLQEVKHLETASDVLEKVVATPALFDKMLPPADFPKSATIIGHLKHPKAGELGIEESLKEVYVLERDYEKVYNGIFSQVRDPTMKARLMSLVLESRAHAAIVGRMLESMEVQVPGL
jgi:rubrerythrin